MTELKSRLGKLGTEKAALETAAKKASVAAATVQYDATAAESRAKQAEETAAQVAMIVPQRSASCFRRLLLLLILLVVVVAMSGVVLVVARRGRTPPWTRGGVMRRGHSEFWSPDSTLNAPRLDL
jgi:hypothetical protein